MPFLSGKSPWKTFRPFLQIIKKTLKNLAVSLSSVPNVHVFDMEKLWETAQKCTFLPQSYT